MLHATELLGAETYDAHGNFVGRVKELFIEPADQPNRVARVLLGRGKFRPLLARYDQVSFVAPGTLRLNVDELALEPYRPNEAWLAVRKDLLDQQIIDTSGRKVVRVNDLDFNEQRTNGSVEIRVTQVDVGVTGAVRRLLQGLVPPSMIRGIQAKLPPAVIPWEFVNLIESDPLRRVKLRLTHNRLAQMHPAELADILEELSPAERQAIIASLDEVAAAKTLAELDERLKTQVFEKLDPEKAAEIIEEMAPDEAADLLGSLAPETSREVLQEMPREDAQEMRELLQFEEHTAGGMMTTDFALVGEDATRGEVVDYLRYQLEEIKLDQLDRIFLVNSKALFAGSVPIGRLLLSEPERKMAELRGSDRILSIHPEAEEKEVFEIFDKYNLRSLAVVDQESHPVGIITVDDVVMHMRVRL